MFLSRYIIGVKNTDVPSKVTRGDDNFTSPTNAKGGRKSHIDEDGNLKPANPNGDTTVSQHVRGGRDVKDNSPYTSTSSEGSGTAKTYGDNSIEIDTKRLQQDIDAGKVKDVEIIPPKKVQTELQNKVDASQKRYDNNPSPRNEIRLERAQGDLDNAIRDNETLIKGTIPSDYIK